MVVGTVGLVPVDNIELPLTFCRHGVDGSKKCSPQPWESLTVATGAGDRVEVPLRGGDPVDHQQPGHAVRAGVRHHRLKELIHRHLHDEKYLPDLQK